MRWELAGLPPAGASLVSSVHVYVVFDGPAAGGGCACAQCCRACPGAAAARGLHYEPHWRHGYSPSLAAGGSITLCKRHQPSWQMRILGLTNSCPACATLGPPQPCRWPHKAMRLCAPTATAPVPPPEPGGPATSSSKVPAAPVQGRGLPPTPPPQHTSTPLATKIASNSAKLGAEKATWLRGSKQSESQRPNCSPFPRAFL
jgi:hypothetical protein